MPDPGFDAFRYAHEHRHDVVWMSQNTNHLVPPAVIADALGEAIRDRRYEGYPYAPGDPELKRLVLADLGFPEDTPILVSAGGTESLYMLTRALLRAGDEVVASDPSYLIIHKFIELSGGRLRVSPIYRPPYRLTADQVNESLGDKCRMILLIDPLNPLGSGYPRDEVRALAEIAHDRHLLILNDVTYRDFADDHALAASFAPAETLTVWSVAKNCGLAGLRLGGLIGPKELVDLVKPYNTNDLGVSVLAQVAGAAALRTKHEWFPSVKSTTRSNQDRIRHTVEKVPGAALPLFPSQANMFVIDIRDTGVAPQDLQRELLLHHGIFVRAGNYLSARFGDRFVRVSFSNPPSEIERFVDAFPKAVSTLRAHAVAA